MAEGGRGVSEVLPMPARSALRPADASGHGQPAKIVRFDPRALDRARICERIEGFLVGNSLAGAIAEARRRDPALPSAATLRRWHAAWKAGSAGALMSRRRGRQRKAYGWEARAVDLYGLRSRPAAATVAYWLRGEGYPTATNSRVLRFLRALPETVAGENSPHRAGRNYYRQNIGPYVRRDPSVLDVGLIYEGDGHTCDVYVRHPATGQPWRPELTIWIDVRSNYVAGFWFSMAESAVSTLFGLSRALLAHDHVPAAVHADPGSGFINRLLLDESLGWLSRLHIDVLTALPGNPKGKGLVEGWFRWFEERVGKRYSSFCGHCRTDDQMRRLKQSIRDGQVNLPSLPDYAAAVGEYVEAYNRTPQRGLGGAPAEIWQGLQRNPVELTEAALLRPSEKRVARRGGVEMFGRIYRAKELLLLDGRKVEVEYDLTDDRRVWINSGSRQVCEARLAQRKPWAAASRIEDFRAQRKSGRKRRLERKLQQVEAEERPVIDVEAAAYAAELAPPESAQLPERENDYADYL